MKRALVRAARSLNELAKDRVVSLFCYAVRVMIASFYSSTRPSSLGCLSAMNRAELEAIDVTVSKLRELSRVAGLEFVLRVGRLLTNAYCEGDVACCEQTLSQSESFRELARRPDVPMSAAVLCRCVAIYALCVRTNASARFDSLTVTHFRAVLGLPEHKQIELLALAHRDGWSARRLEKYATELRRKTGKRGKRRASQSCVTAMHLLHKVPLPPEVADVRNQSVVAKDELRRIVESVERAVHWFDVWTSVDPPVSSAPFGS